MAASFTVNSWAGFSLAVVRASVISKEPWPGRRRGVQLSGQIGMGEEGRFAFVAGPVVEAGVVVPLEEVDVAFDGAACGDGGPCAVVEVGVLPAVGGAGGRFPFGTADEDGCGQDARRGGNDFDDERVAVVGLDGEDVVAGVKLAGDVDMEDVHLEARERVGIEVGGFPAVEVDLSGAWTGKIELGGLGSAVQMQVDAEVARLVALGLVEVGRVGGPDVLLGERLVEGGEEDGLGKVAGGVELARRWLRGDILG